MLVRFLQPAQLTHYHHNQTLSTVSVDIGDEAAILDANGFRTEISLEAHSADWHLVTEGDDTGEHWLYRWMDQVADPDTDPQTILELPPLQPLAGEQLAAFQRIRIATAINDETAYGPIYQRVNG